MSKRILLGLRCVAFMAMGAALVPVRAFAANREFVELESRVELLNDQLTIMQQGLDENFAAITESMQDTAARAQKLQQQVASMRQDYDRQSIVTRVGQLEEQLESFRASAKELSASVTAIDQRASALSAGIAGYETQTMPVTGSASPPDTLFRNALTDYEAGRYSLSSQEFAEFLQSYPDDQRAGSAQFYLADAEYWTGDYANAVQDFDKLLQQYPGTKASAAELKKALALLRLGERNAATSELREVIEQYPGSNEAAQARMKLAKLTAAAE